MSAAREIIENERRAEADVERAVRSGRRFLTVHLEQDEEGGLRVVQHYPPIGGAVSGIEEAVQREIDGAPPAEAGPIAPEVADIAAILWPDRRVVYTASQVVEEVRQLVQAVQKLQYRRDRACEQRDAATAKIERLEEVLRG